jgi:hypothetical protein
VSGEDLSEIFFERYGRDGQTTILLIKEGCEIFNVKLSNTDCTKKRRRNMDLITVFKALSKLNCVKSFFKVNKLEFEHRVSKTLRRFFSHLTPLT